MHVLAGPGRSTRRSRLTAALPLAAILAASVEAVGAERKLVAPVGPDGVTSLEWAGVDLLVKGKPWVDGMVFETVGKDEKGFKDYKFEKVGGGNPQVKYDAAKKLLSYRYDWGSVEFAYSPPTAADADRLGIGVTIANRSERTLADFDVKLMRIKFPAGPKVLGGSGRMVAGPDHIGALEVPYGIDTKPGAGGPTFGVSKISEKLLACCETFEPELNTW